MIPNVYASVFAVGGTDHVAASCHYVECVCHKCHKKGNLARVCRSQRSAGGDPRRAGAAAKAHHLTTANSEPEEEIPLFDLGKGHSAHITVDVELNGVPVSMELDTGAVVSVMSQQQQQELFPQAQLQPSKVILRTYMAQSVGMAGTLPVHAVYGEQEQDPSLVIVKAMDLPCLARIGSPTLD